MRRLLVGVLLGLSFPIVRAESPAPATAEITAVLTAQAAAWNRGDVNAFMAGYAPVADLRFASGGNVTRGWQPTLERYQKSYPDHAAMGVLTFTDLEVTVLAPEAAIVFGHWALQREKGAPHGLFTLTFRKFAEGWRIIQDHTSIAAP